MDNGVINVYRYVYNLSVISYQIFVLFFLWGAFLTDKVTLFLFSGFFFCYISIMLAWGVCSRIALEIWPVGYEVIESAAKVTTGFDCSNHKNTLGHIPFFFFSLFYCSSLHYREYKKLIHLHTYKRIIKISILFVLLDMYIMRPFNVKLCTIIFIFRVQVNT